MDRRMSTGIYSSPLMTNRFSCRRSDPAFSLAPFTRSLPMTGSDGKGPKPNQQTGTTCARPPSRRRLPSRPAAPTSTASTTPSTGSDASSTTSCSRSSSAASTPRSRSARSAEPHAVRRRHPGSRHQPADRPHAHPCAVPSRSCRRSPASGSPRRPASAKSSAFTMRSRHGRRPP